MYIPLILPLFLHIVWGTNKCLRVEVSRSLAKTLKLFSFPLPPIFLTMVSSVHHLVAITLAVAVPIHAFTSTSSSSIGCPGSRGSYQLGATTDDASAQALSDYMAKSHEEKLRAIKAVEDKKNAEIEVSGPYFCSLYVYIIMVYVMVLYDIYCNV